jgi:hypothetical protein
MPTASLGVVEPRDKLCKPSLRVATFDDYEQIAAVEAANGLSTKPRDQWLHLWQNNPACRQLPDWPIGWVLETHSGRIVGALENVPCLYRLAGRTYVAAFGRGWAVDMAYRVYALQLIVRQMRQPHVDLFLTTTANSRTTALLNGWNWSQVPVGRWDRSVFWMASYAQAARSLLVKTPRFVSSLAAPLLSGAFRCEDAARRRRGPHRWELRWWAGFDQCFDQFWAELQQANSHRLLAVRTSENLRWHFKYALDQNRLSILTASLGSRLIAYALFERRPVPSLHLERALLIDFQSLTHDPGLVAAMISFALDHYRVERVPIIENMGCWLEARQPLTPRPHFRRVLGSWSYLYHATNHELAETLRNPDPWYPTQFDADASL